MALDLVYGAVDDAESCSWKAIVNGGVVPTLEGFEEPEEAEAFALKVAELYKKHAEGFGHRVQLRLAERGHKPFVASPPPRPVDTVGQGRSKTADRPRGPMVDKLFGGPSDRWIVTRDYRTDFKAWRTIKVERVEKPSGRWAKRALWLSWCEVRFANSSDAKWAMAHAPGLLEALEAALKENPDR